MRTAEERLALLDEMLGDAAASGLLLRTADDLPLDGRTLMFDGRPMLNFGSCSYLGLELDPRMQMAVCKAVMRYGTQFSSSRTYLQAPPYAALEERLHEMFGGPSLVVPSTTMGHATALPVLVGSRDAVIVDQQVHHSVQMAVNHLRAQGTVIEMIRHSDVGELEAAIARHADRPRIWYLADGVYSMFADIAPLDELERLLDSEPRLHLYIDDSHGVGWCGRHGRGPALERLGNHPRLVVAASLNKSFAASGAALIFPDEESKRRVRLLGGPMIFSGPVQPPMLSAALESVAIHLSDEFAGLQGELRERITHCKELLEEFCLPLASGDGTPIFFIPVGLPEPARELCRRLLDDGIYTNIAHFPAVPMKQAGVRFTITRHHRPEDIVALVHALARHVPAVIGPPASCAALGAPVGGASRRPSLRLEHHRTIDAMDTAEWDRLLGDRGTFSAAGLRFLEQAFSREGRPEDRWDFHYYVVRDDRDAPVLATWFTAGLWKDDMLATAEVSALVEERRQTDPYFLVSRTLGMGSLLTEGDHLYLDRARDWRSALSLLSDAVAAQAAQSGAATIAIRDLDTHDTELADALRERGFVAIAMPDSYVIDPVIADDATWLAELSERARRHQRREVLGREDQYEVEVLRHGARVPDDDELELLHRLYLNVRERSLEINSFELPETLLRDMLDHPCWELVVLRLRAGAGGPADGRPVAFGAHYVGRGHYAPLLVGLDYDYVASHGAYRQALRQALLRARTHGASRVLLGMGAPLEKRRFGARPHARTAWVQSADHYGADVLAELQAAAASAGAGCR
jgi:7-keto-8-aminopelargonate synthetase-like enzyme/predicted N-acyltransferase